MPPRKRKEDESTPNVTPVIPVNNPPKEDAPMFDLESLEVRDAPAPLPKSKRVSKKVDPMLAIVAGKVKVSVDAGYVSKDIGPMPSEQAKKVKALMYRAAREAGHGIKVRDVPSEDDPNLITLRFEAKREKKVRRYTADQVREWADTTYTDHDAKEMFGYVKGKRVPAALAAAYRDAHDL